MKEHAADLFLISPFAGFRQEMMNGMTGRAEEL
jgi:hypothetical protein